MTEVLPPGPGDDPTNPYGWRQSAPYIPPPSRPRVQDDYERVMAIDPDDPPVEPVALGAGPASPEGPHNPARCGPSDEYPCNCRSPEGPDEGLREQVTTAVRTHYVINAVLPLLTAERERADEAVSLTGRAIVVAATAERERDEARERADRLARVIAAVRRALDDELANLADDGARLSHAVVRRIEAALSATDPGGTDAPDA